MSIFNKLHQLLFKPAATHNEINKHEAVKDTKSNQSSIDQVQAIYRKHNYANIPYILDEESAKWILDNLGSFFGAILVPKEYMDNIEINGHNYVTGDIVLLWWLTSRKNNNIDNTPLYFARTYGIDTKLEAVKLKNNHLISDNYKQLTNEGEKVLKKYKIIIKHHRASKTWNGTGPVKYTYPKKIVTEVPAKYDHLTKLEKTPWYLFDSDLKDAKSAHLRYVKWTTSTTPCPKCEALGATNNGKGPGVYPVKDAKSLREHLHPGCTCRIFGYRVSGPHMVVEGEEYWNRNPKTGKGYYIKAKKY